MSAAELASFCFFKRLRPPKPNFSSLKLRFLLTCNKGNILSA